MKFKVAATALLGCMVAGGAFAQTDDVKWVNQCVQDSAGYQVTEQVKIMYCACMVGKMSDKESRSVTQQEQANPEAAKDCAKRAGWKQPPGVVRGLMGGTTPDEPAERDHRAVERHGATLAAPTPAPPTVAAPAARSRNSTRRSPSSLP